MTHWNGWRTSLVVVAGNLNTVAHHAEKLRLAVITDECSVVLDHLTVEINIEKTDEAINSLFPGRFVEPWIVYAEKSGKMQSSEPAQHAKRTMLCVVGLHDKLHISFVQKH
jgi:hypothetical protein